MRLRTAISLIIIAAFGAGLAACGGGSVSTGGGSGSGGTGGASSSLILQAPQRTSGSDFQGSPQQDTRLASVISDFLVSKALAQADETVFLLDGEGDVVATGVTGPDGQVAIPVESGEYTVCIGEEEPEVCTEDTVVVADDQLVFATLELVIDPETEEESLIIASVEAQDAEDDIVDPQDLDNANEVQICHKGKFTISVAEPAAMNGHTVHGDSMGPCADDPSESAETESFGISDDDDSGGNGNNGNRGNRGNGNNPNA